MATIIDVSYYLVKGFPTKHALSKARTTKMVYLADWRSAILYGSQLTQIGWKYDNYGPFTWDVHNTIKANPQLIEVIADENDFGEPRHLYSINDPCYEPCLSQEETEILEHVISSTKDLNYREFIDLVYSTYPIAMNERYSMLPLVELARDYTAILKELNMKI